MENDINTSYSLIFPQIFSSLIKERKITQSVLSEIIGVSNQAVSAYCSGKIYPDYKVLLKIASFFNVSIDYLLTGKRVENKSIRDELKLSDNAINNLRSIAENFSGTFFALDSFLSDEEFFTVLDNAVSECINNKIMYEQLSFESKGELTGILSSLLGNSYINASVDKPLRILRDYFLSFFSKYWIKLDELPKEQKQSIIELNKEKNGDIAKEWGTLS